MDSPTFNGNKTSQRPLRRNHETTLSPRFSKQFAHTPRGYVSRGRKSHGMALQKREFVCKSNQGRNYQ